MNNIYKKIVNKYVHKFQFITYLMLSIGTISLAQDVPAIKLIPGNKIKGLIKLEDAENVAVGASVHIKGKNKGTIVDINGNFTLSASPTDTLIVSFVGYKDEVIPVGNLTQLNISLVPDTQTLQAVEIVAVGYGKADRSKLTGSVASISAKDLDSHSLSFDNALSGKLAGVQVNTNSGQPGTATAITIRGISTFQSSNNNPLIVIDGVPVYGGNRSLNQNNYQDRRMIPFGTFGNTTVRNNFNPSTEFERNPLANLNPDDIESIDVLKDAYATAIYGSRGAAGVILVTTKKGSRGQNNINVGYRVGFNKPIGKHDLLNGSQYGKLYTDFYLDLKGPQPPGEEFVFPTDNNIDWQDKILRTAVSQNFNVSLSGGTDKSKYYTSLSTTQNPSYIINNDFERYTARINYDYEPHDIVTLGINAQLSQTDNSSLNAPNIYLKALSKAPNVPIKDAKGKYIWNHGKNKVGDIDNNPVAIANENINYLKDFRTVGNLYFEVRPKEWLSLKTELGLDVLSSEAYSREKDRPILLGAGGSAVQTTRFNFRTVINNTLTFNNQFGSHDINAVIGQSFESSKERLNRLTGSDFFDDDLLSIGISGKPRVNQSGFNEWALVSYFGRINYIFDSRYIAGVTYRLDGSSKFARNHQYVGFPSFSVGWVISEESFLEQANWLKRLKLRGSLGFSGVNGAGSSYYGSQGSFNFPKFPNSYVNIRSLEMVTPVNPNLKWEITRTYDVGLDMEAFDGLISLTVDYYHKLSTDLLNSSAMASYKGFSSVQQNIGSVLNTGIEVDFGVHYQKGDFGLNSNFNIANNTNEVLELNRAGQQKATAANNYKYMKEGEPIGQFYLDQWAGVDPKTGDPQWRDKDGKLIKSPKESAKRAFGTAMPDFFGGFHNTITYKNISLTVSFNYSFGGQLLNASRAKLLTYSTKEANNLSTEILNSWKKKGGNTDIPKLNNNEVIGISDFVHSPNNSRFLEDNSFIRLKTLKLAYNFPKSIVSKVALRNIQCYVEGANLWTWTRYSGLDPEVTIGGSSALLSGIDNLTMPLVKSWAFGINISI